MTSRQAKDEEEKSNPIIFLIFQLYILNSKF
jgi:hypothetical protein